MSSSVPDQREGTKEKSVQQSFCMNISESLLIFRITQWQIFKHSSQSQKTGIMYFRPLHKMYRNKHTIFSHIIMEMKLPHADLLTYASLIKYF